MVDDGVSLSPVWLSDTQVQKLWHWLIPGEQQPQLEEQRANAF
jgi:hypothetical protein